MGARVGRVNDMCYHLNHERTFNSHYHNPVAGEYGNLAKMRADKKSIVDYYEEQEYVKREGVK